MATGIDWKDFYRGAKKTMGPRLRDLRGRDRDDWLATIGLEKRNVTADVFGAIGLIAVGCGIGVAIGMLFAPKRGEELRREMNEKVRSQAGKLGAGAEAGRPPGYAS
jgi:hypothetical protein